MTVSCSARGGYEINGVFLIAVKQSYLTKELFNANQTEKSQSPIQCYRVGKFRFEILLLVLYIPQIYSKVYALSLHGWTAAVHSIRH